MSVDTEVAPEPSALRELPAQIVIPAIRGEMLRLKPATMEDLSLLDVIDAYYNASVITGKDQQSERAVVRSWVERSVAWSRGQIPDSSDVFDPQSRGTIAWSILTDANTRDPDRVDAAKTAALGQPAEPAGPNASDTGASAGSAAPDAVGADHQTTPDGSADGSPDGCKVIGMIFLIDIDPWARSARIQVILGKDYRGRGYSRDAMPRVMTYGFAPEHVGLNLHRIWVAVPSINTRSLSVYKSLGFVQSGAARDAMWDAENNKYQDLIVMDTLADEYDPLRSLDAFGMHVFEDNPGVAEAIEAHERQQSHRHVARGKAADHHVMETAAGTPEDGGKPQPREADPQHAPHQPADAVQVPHSPSSSGSTAIAGAAEQETAPDGRLQRAADGDEQVSAQATQAEAPGGTGLWPFNANSGKNSKRAWWRNLGRNGRRDTEDRQS